MRRLKRKNILEYFFCLLLLAGCKTAILIEEPDVLAEKGIALGDEKNEVVDLLGKEHMEINWRQGGYRVSVVEYDTHQVDYNPGFEGEDYSSPIHSSPGFKERMRRDYRLVFVDDRLYSIEDFIHNRYSALSRENAELEAILQDIWESR